MNDAHPARRVWLAIEPIHAVTYFDPGCRQASDALGMKGFWMGYFAFRAAPLGPIGPAPVQALFAGFLPAWVHRALPDAWQHASPEACIEARSTSAAAALRGAGIGEDECRRAVTLLEPVVAGLDVTGRALTAANAELPLPDDPVGRLWQLTTTLREHRGDGHVAALVSAGVSGLEAHLLQVAAGEAKWGSRGWSDEARGEAEDGLRSRGLLDRDGELTVEGHDVRLAVETRTDAAAWSGGLAPLGGSGVDQLVEVLAAATAAAGGLLWYPNPIGLPAGG